MLLVAPQRPLRAEAIELLRAQKQPDLLLLGNELTNQAVDSIRDGDLAHGDITH